MRSSFALWIDCLPLPDLGSWSERGGVGATDFKKFNPDPEPPIEVDSKDVAVGVLNK